MTTAFARDRKHRGYVCESALSRFFGIKKTDKRRFRLVASTEKRRGTKLLYFRFNRYSTKPVSYFRAPIAGGAIVALRKAGLSNSRLYVSVEFVK